MSPAKTAKSIVCCDSCMGLVRPGETYHIDASGYLLCPTCAQRGDMVARAV
jgi:hypothetical protein